MTRVTAAETESGSLDAALEANYHSTMRMNDKVLDVTLMALAHPTRRAILERLIRGESRVTELAEPFAMSLNAVSKHICVLERAGLVRRRRVWREHLVSFNPAPLEEVSAWIDKRRKFWNQRLDALEVLLKAEDAAAAKPEKKGHSR